MVSAPSTTATWAGLAGGGVSIIFLLMAVFFPEAYARAQAYPGAEATVAGFVITLTSFIAAWVAREKRYKMVQRLNK